MEVKSITPEQAAEYSDRADTYATEQEIPSLDAKFIEMFHKNGNNGTEAYLMAISPKKVKRKSAATYASALMGKYNLRSKQRNAQDKVKVRDIHHGPRGASEIISYVKKQYTAGIINEEEVWERMSMLARYSTSEQVQFNASKELYAWTREAKSELAASKMSEQDVVILLIESIGDLPKEKYYGVLRGVRARRQALIVRRNEVIDVDGIIANERRLASQ